MEDQKENTEMVSASKTAFPPLGVDDHNSILSIIYRFAKKAAIVGAVYLVGYMQWSVAWLLTPIILSVIRDQWNKESESRRNLAKRAAVSSEKDVVLARLDDLPSWVFFPDVERAEWLNRILHQMWPNVNHYARNLIQDSIEPALAETLKNYKLNGFKFERMALGTIAPRVGGMKVYDKNLSRNEIIMDVDLFYAGDCDISFVLQRIRGGIKDLQLHGMLRVVMKPLISSMPLVGGLQVFFLNNPSIDFNLVGAADILDLPGFSDLLRKAIVEQIGNLMVLPNKLPIKLSDEVPTIDLRMPEPEGVLRIHVVQARNLEKKDISLLGKGKSDPYAVITVGAQTWKTKYIPNNLNPRWDFFCECKVLNFQEPLQVQLFDWDRSSVDDPLGRCSLDIAQVVRVGRLDTWITLLEAKHGKVHLRLSWHRLSTDLGDLQNALTEVALIKAGDVSSAVLSVYIDSCEHLPNARAQSKPDPYITVTVGKKKETTSVQLRNDRPVFEIGYCFLVRDPNIDNLELKVMDSKSSTVLGMLVYPIASLLKQKDLHMISQPVMLQKSGPESKVILSMQLKILKEAVRDENFDPTEIVEELEQDPEPEESTEDQPGTSNKAVPNGKEEPKKKEESVTDSSSQKSIPAEQIVKEVDVAQESAPSGRESPKLVHRVSSITTSAGEAGLGRILLSLRYSMQNQTLFIVVHKVSNIPLKDPANIPDPYVKLYLLPGRSKDTKRKTMTVKDSCMPEYDEQFEWVIPLAELHSRHVEVTVATHKGFLSGSPVIGQVIVHLNQYDFREAKTMWFDLMPESTRE